MHSHNFIHFNKTSEQRHFCLGLIFSRVGSFLKNLGFAFPLSIASLSRAAISNAYKVMLIQGMLANFASMPACNALPGKALPIPSKTCRNSRTVLYRIRTITVSYPNCIVTRHRVLQYSTDTVLYGYGTVRIRYCTDTVLYGYGTVRIRYSTDTVLYGYGTVRIRSCTDTVLYGYGSVTVRYATERNAYASQAMLTSVK